MPSYTADTKENRSSLRKVLHRNFTGMIMAGLGYRKSCHPGDAAGLHSYSSGRGNTWNGGWVKKIMQIELKRISQCFFLYEHEDVSGDDAGLGGVDEDENDEEEEEEEENEGSSGGISFHTGPPPLLSPPLSVSGIQDFYTRYREYYENSISAEGAIEQLNSDLASTPTEDIPSTPTIEAVTPVPNEEVRNCGNCGHIHFNGHYREGEDPCYLQGCGCMQYIATSTLAVELCSSCHHAHHYYPDGMVHTACGMDACNCRSYTRTVTH